MKKLILLVPLWLLILLINSTSIAQQVDGSFAILYGHEQKQAVFTVYPNPASDKIHIRTDKSGAIKIEVSDFSGVPVIQSLLVNKKTLDIFDLPSGVYFVRLERDDGKIQTTRLVKR